MNKEQIAHDLAIKFAGEMLRENSDLYKQLTPDYVSIASLLVKQYSSVLFEITCSDAYKNLP